jgi:hypothetical protein
MVSVRFAPNNAADIIGFTLDGQKSGATIDNDLQLVTTEVPYGTDVTSLAPAIEVSPGATIDPASGTAFDFSDPVVYKVTAQDGITTREWTIRVSVQPNTTAEIIRFSLVEEVDAASVDAGKREITVNVPYGTDVTALAPAIELSPGAEVDPASGVETDFTSPVVYTVTAQDGITSTDWMVSVRFAPNNAAEIIGFTLAGETKGATIDKDLQLVTTEVPYGTDVTSLAPAIEVSPGARIDPASGTAVDFTSEAVFTVTAEDGSTSKQWVVTVTTAPAVSSVPGNLPDKFHLYPNPAAQYLVVELADRAEILIQDLNGRVVLVVTDAMERVTIPVSHLDRGIYLVTIQSISFREVAKVVLE